MAGTRNRPAKKNPVPVYEVMTFLNQRSVGGRIVINPPSKMAPLDLHKTGETWYFCYICGRSTSDQNKHLKHMKEHTDNRNEPLFHSHAENNGNKYEGSEFNHDSDSEDEPLINLAAKKSKGSLGCNHCPATFFKLDALRTHSSSVHNDNSKTVKCSQCQKSFLTIRRHIQRHHNPENPFKCSSCTYRFATRNLLNFHIAYLHRSRKKDKGRYKQKKVPTTATADVIYRCSKCQATFDQLKTLRVHFSIHAGEKIERPFQCGLCPLKFRLYSTLSGHKKMTHTDGTIKCPHCACSYHSAGNCRRHINRYHSEMSETR